jgi:hypothetical protein
MAVYRRGTIRIGGIGDVLNIDEFSYTLTGEVELRVGLHGLTAPVLPRANGIEMSFSLFCPTGSAEYSIIIDQWQRHDEVKVTVRTADTVVSVLGFWDGLSVEESGTRMTVGFKGFNPRIKTP